MKKISIIVSIIHITSACQKKTDNEKLLIKNSGWLLGSWELKTNTGTLTENWTKVNDSTYKALSLFIKDKDTIHYESIILQEKEETLTYTTTIKGQNNEKPISFKMKEEVEKGLVFENLKHDYPQKISYQKTNNGIIAEISGVQSGKASSEKFILHKKN